MIGQAGMGTAHLLGCYVSNAQSKSTVRLAETSSLLICRPWEESAPVSGAEFVGGLDGKKGRTRARMIFSHRQEKGAF